MAHIDEGGILGPGTHAVHFFENEERYSGDGNPYWGGEIRCLVTQATRRVSFHVGFMRDCLRATGVWTGPRDYKAEEVLGKPFTIKLEPGTYKDKSTGEIKKSMEVMEVSAPAGGAVPVQHVQPTPAATTQTATAPPADDDIPF